ncbi:XdhC family protein [Bacillus sp. FJAT-44742]|uniref:XdhC family protein n=1 Tax=Bacillus sp. FJAT-44742 TaxID=2014005 RepID=UPI000C241F17|nr:XdhC family protein [Bacillus sp. FJAT-44742]
MDTIYEILEEIDSSSQRAMLATIVHVEGSAYRKEGTSMLVKRDGAQIGVLSAGCLEEDILARKDSVLARGSTKIVYDMRNSDEISWGEGSGCNGKIEVLLEPLDDIFLQQLKMLRSQLAKGKEVLMGKKIDVEEQRAECFFLTEDNDVFGDWEIGDHMDSIKELRNKAAKEGLTCGKQLSLDPLIEVYFHYFQPKPKLFIFGAGPDAVPLASFADQSGFTVTVADWRPALCTKERFPEAVNLMTGFPEELMQQMTLTPKDSVILMTHNFHKDKEILSHVKDKPLRYLGVLGSQSRTSRLLEKKDVPSFIHSPIGLDIGAEGPEQIALSVVAELVKVVKKRPVPEKVST